MKIEEITRRYREEHGLSQRQFAAQCGLSAPYIWYLEQGIHPQTGKRIQPSITSLNKIARGLGLTFDELINQCDNMLVSTSPDENINDVFVAMFSKLTDAQKDAVIAVMRSYLS